MKLLLMIFFSPIMQNSMALRVVYLVARVVLEVSQAQVASLEVLLAGFLGPALRRSTNFFFQSFGTFAWHLRPTSVNQFGKRGKEPD
jgi:hypothetical protein